MSEEKKNPIHVLRIVLSIKGHDIPLTMDEVKELKAELMRLLPEPQVVKEYLPSLQRNPFQVYGGPQSGQMKQSPCGWDSV